MNDKFRITKDASGSPVYTHNNEVVSKDVFDQRSQKSSDETNAMRSAVTPGIDDDPSMMEIKEKVRAMQVEKKPIKKAQGGKVSSASSRADGICIKGKTRGKMV
jgi:hypothetical protein